MRLSPSFVSLLVFATAALACPGEEGHHHEKRAAPSAPLTPPSRPLEWGDINIIHTTDSHGWLLGHQKSSFPEPNYSGDLGDFSSFVHNMKQLAEKKDVDLLLVDSGDLHDGTGITDGFPPGGVDAHEANKFLAKIPYDVMAIGNHELYIYNNTLDMYKNFAPKLNGRYLSSNANITITDKQGNAVSVPVGARYAKFKTRMGRKVTSLGVLFDFTGNDKKTTVQKVEDMVKEAWFAEAIQEEPDFFLLAGHMPVQNDKWPYVFNAIRAVHKTTPILILGGHTHIRDCVQPDGRSMALESGRYLETVGWMSVKLDRKGSTGNLTFSRRYLDPNRVTYEFHAGKHGLLFDTILGKAITAGLKVLYKAFNLDFTYGTAPHDYTLSRDPYDSENSLLNLYSKQAMPIALTANNSRVSIPHLMITNSGSQRFDVYAGAFTKNDQLTASPFTDAFLYIPEVPAGIANKVFSTLNGNGADQRRSFHDSELYGRGHVDHIYRAWLESMDKRGGVERRAAKNATLGYVTTDSCPGVGDDTLHAPLPYYDSPDFISSAAPNVTDDTPIDLVFVDFIETQLLGILNTIQTTKNYTTSDVSLYTSVLASEVLGVYAQQAWN